MPGVTAIASDQIAAGAALMVDASQIAGNSDPLMPGISRQASVVMDTAPNFA